MSTSATASPTTRAPELNNNVITTWLPLTTTFTPAAKCSTLYMKWFNDLVAWDPGYGIFVETESTACQPTQMTSWWDADHLSTAVDLASTQFSIGPVACPESYTTATTVTAQQSSTLVACCPSSYKFNTIGGVGQCRSQLSPGQVLTFMERFDVEISSSEVSNSARTTATSVETTTTWTRITSTVPSATATEYLYAIPVNGWLFPTQNSQSTGGGNQTNTNTTTTDTDDDGGLSSGAKAGLGVGIGVGGAAVIAALAVWFLRRRKRKAAGTPVTQYSMPDDAHAHGQSQPLTYGDRYGGEPKHNATDTPQPPPSEMYTPRQYHEMPAEPGNRAELA